MEQVLMSELPLDNEIAAVREQIEALRHRRSLLSHTLLSSRKLKTQLSRTNPTPRLPPAAIESIKTLIKEHEDVAVANLHRTCSGITAFRVQDPDPNAVDGGNVLGIRFEIISTEKRAFGTPYYVLLNQLSGDGRLRVHKHTIPVFLPMQSLIRRYMPLASEDEKDNPKGQAKAQNLPMFVRALRKELVSHHKRLEAYRRLKEGVEGRYGVQKVELLDRTGNEIEIVFSDYIVARLRVGTDEAIEKVVVGPLRTAAPSISAESRTRAHREVKKAIEGAGGRIDDLIMRLQNRRIS